MTHSSGVKSLRIAALVAALLAPSVALGQSSTEIIRGRVFGPDSLPLADAEVIVTGLVTRMSRTTRTDSKGSFTVLFTNPESDYLVATRKLGYVSTSFRLTRTGIASVLSANVYLAGTVVSLDTVKVRSLATPGADKASVGETSSGNLADVLFLADPSRLLELLLSMPGIYATDSGFSVGGAGADGNLRMLDGVAVRDNVGIPADALSSTRVITSSADPSRGGFSGGVVSHTLRGGTDIFAATVRGSNSNRSMVWHDAAWPNAVPRINQTSGTAGGPLTKRVAKYQVSWSFNDRTTDWYSLLQPRPSLLSQRGIALDTVDAVASALGTLGIPLSRSNIPDDFTNQSLSTTEVFDITPNATTSLRFTHSGTWAENIGSFSGNSLTSFPTNANRTGFSANSFQGKFSGYIKGFLNETNFSYNHYRDYSNPFTNIPSASVRIGTHYDDGRTGFTTLGFGGGPGEYYENSGNGQISNELSWLPASGTHKVKIGGQFGMEQSKYYFFPNQPLLGNYTYLSTADLIANQPASYERLLNTSARNTRATSTAAWIGDEWTVSKAFQLQTGIRFDFAHPLTTPKYNAAADSVFGIRTDRIPDNFAISPRLGFSWVSKARRGQGSPGGSSSLGGLSAQQIQSMPGELVMSMMNVQRSSTLPGIGVSGNIGAYRGYTSNSTIADLVESTGIASRILLSCVGPAVPIPDWNTMTEGPTSCAGGSGSASTFSIARPLVRVFDPSYQPATRWNASVGVDGIRVPKQWILSVNSGVSYIVNQQSSIDRNLNPTPRFNMAAEGGRPVYVDATSIVPATGAISPGASRVSPEFGVVTNQISDIHSFNTQLRFNLAPPRPLIRGRVNLQLSYNMTGGITEQRGNSRAGISGNPFTKEWIRSPEPLHSIRLNASARVWWLNLGISSFVQSGIPFTPMVSGDINGDGNSNNDRAFVPNPATTTDTSLARQLNDLLAVTPSVARRCLTSQFGRMAGVSNCYMPWQMRVDLNASLTPPSSWGYNDRLRVTMQVQNASGGLVRLLHMENTPLGRTTLSTNPIQQLLYVTGFDTTTQQFKYRVNQLFGQPNNFGSLRRRYAPIQLQMGLEYKFGGPPLNPMSRGLGLREPVNKPALTDAERRAAVAKLRRDPVQPILQRSDSLHLAPDQVASLSALSKEYNAKADTALAPLTKWVTRKGRRVFDQDLSLRLTPAQTALGKLNTEYGKKALAVLNAEQRAGLSEAASGAAKKQQ